MSRLPSRLAVLPRAALNTLGKRKRPVQMRRILIAHNLLLGDTLMLTALLARVRRNWPDAHIAMTVAPALLPLYAGRPYGVEVLPFDPHRAATARRIAQSGPYDWALVPGENRYTWLAHAAGAAWISVLDEPGPKLRSIIADALVPWPEAPSALADIFASLAGPGVKHDITHGLTDGVTQGDAHGNGHSSAHSDAESFDARQWPAPACAAFDRPRAPYCVLHVGAGSSLRHWPPERWQQLAKSLVHQGFSPVWSGSAQERALIAHIDPEQRFASTAGKLDFAQLWHLLHLAALVVVPDTGIAHLAKLTGTPTVCLFGPGSDVLFGAGTFWRNHAFVPVIEANFPCRDQHTLFGRHLPWAQRCQRSTAQCAAPACMHALDADRVLAACMTLLKSA